MIREAVDYDSLVLGEWALGEAVRISRMPLSALESVCQRHASAELPLRVRELLFVASKEGFFEAEPSELDFAADVALRQTGFGNFSEMQKKIGVFGKISTRFHTGLFDIRK